MPTAIPPAGPWGAWYDFDDEGFIRDAGVDTKDRGANVCVVTLDTIEAADKDAFNAHVRRDAELLAAAPELLRVLARLAGVLNDVNAVGLQDEELVACQLLHDLEKKGVVAR
jgi:hypothetical protein